MLINDTLLSRVISKIHSSNSESKFRFTELQGWGETASTFDKNQFVNRALNIAVQLNSSAVPLSRALVLCSNTVDHVCACLGAFLAGVTVIPCRSLDAAQLEAALEKLSVLSEKAKADCIIVSMDTEILLDIMAQDYGSLCDLPKISMEHDDIDIDNSFNVAFKENPEDSVFEFATRSNLEDSFAISEVNREELDAAVASIIRENEINTESRIAVWLNPKSAWGTIIGSLVGVLVDCPIIFLNQRLEGAELLRWLGNERITHSFGDYESVDFESDLSQLSVAEREALSVWRCLFTAAKHSSVSSYDSPKTIALIKYASFEMEKLVPSRIQNQGTKQEVKSVEDTSAEEKTLRAFLRKTIEARISKTLNLDEDAPFANQGLGSAEVIEITDELSHFLGRELSPSMFYDHSSFNQLVRYLVHGEQSDEIVIHDSKIREPIAIIGMACRFPGTKSATQFWESLLASTDQISVVPESRFSVEKYYDEDQTIPGKLTTQFGGFIQDIEEFDASFFGISRREAESMDPQQRLLLEVTWEALEDAGIVPQRLRGEKVGVIVGIAGSEYGAMQLQNYKSIEPHSGTGSATSIAANRISYTFDFRGPSYAIDTACSSSLASVHLACQSIWAGESPLVIAGGTNMILSPALTINFSKASAMAKDGRCKMFDDSADGYVRSEGVGLTVLKPLSVAQRDGDSIYAVIHSTATIQDGRTNGLMAPNKSSQVAVIREALARASVEPEQISFVEAHGTGTFLGDTVESEALSQALRPESVDAPPCWVGSAKTSIGHLEGAAGVAGLMKCALSLHHRTLAPNLHLKKVNDRINLEKLRLRVPTTQEPLASQEAAIYAGLSSFGFGGTNVHAILSTTSSSDYESIQSKPQEDRLYLLPLSARTPKSLGQLARKYADWLEKTKVSSLDLTYSASVRREHHNSRATFIFRTQEELIQQLRAESITSVTLGPRKPKLVFVYAGQGGQWQQMGKDLYEQNTIFRREIDRCADEFKKHVDWELLEVFNSDFSRIDHVQPAVFAVQVALTAVWKALGVIPDLQLGHSMGEMAAAYCAGAMSFEDACLVACVRSKIAHTIANRGGMLFCGISEDEALQYVNRYEGKIELGAQNGQFANVLSGDKDVLKEIQVELDDKDVFNRWVKISVASHSHQIEWIREKLITALSPVNPQVNSIPMWSTVTTKLVSDIWADAEYWTDNLRKPVRFYETIKNLSEGEDYVYLEVSPHPLLLSSIAESVNGVFVESMRRNQGGAQQIAQSLGTLYRSGVSIDWEKIYRADSCAYIRLPTYAWDQEPHWSKYVGDLSENYGAEGTGIHWTPLLGAEIGLAAKKNERAWQSLITLESHPWLLGHVVEGEVLVPGAFYLWLAHLVRQYEFPEGETSLHHIEFLRGLVVSEDSKITFQVVSQVLGPSERRISFYSTDKENPDWICHCQLYLEVASSAAQEQNKNEKVLPDTAQWPKIEDFYERLATNGLTYKGDFQGLETIQMNSKTAIGSLSEKSKHPVARLDSVFQMVAAILDQAEGGGVLKSIRQLTLVGLEQSRVVAKVEGDDQCSLVLQGEDGDVCVVVEGLQISRNLASNHLSDIMEITWNVQELSLDLKTTISSEIYLIGAPEVREYIRSTLGAEVKITDWESLGDWATLLTQCHKDDHIIFASALGKGITSAERSASNVTEELLRELSGLVNEIEATQAIDLPKLTILTTGGQSLPQDQVEPNPIHASLWGFGRVLINEKPEIRTSLLDADDWFSRAAADALNAQLSDNAYESYAMVRGEKHYVPRINTVSLHAEDSNGYWSAFDDKPFRLVSTERGYLTNLTYQVQRFKKLEPDDVRVKVHAVGMNFSDVLKALGVYKGPAEEVLGGEFSGEVVEIGTNVTSLRVGDSVCGIGSHCYSNFVTTKDFFLIPLDSSESYVSAAARPMAFLTAGYAIRMLGRIQSGDKILITSATGGVGLAAIHIAKKVGAQIVATAGTEEKRQYLSSLGIGEVYDSRQELGLNCLSDAKSEHRFDLIFGAATSEQREELAGYLAPGGRYLDISLNDVPPQRLGLNRAYFAINIAKLMGDEPQLSGRLLKEYFTEFADVPFRVEEASALSIRDVFARVAQAKHIGKVVVKFPHEKYQVTYPRVQLSASGTYLIVGGTGGLGTELTKSLLAKNVARVVLASRSGEIGSSLQSLIESVAPEKIEVRKVDVTDPKQVKMLIEELRGDLAGVFQLAGILDDFTISDYSSKRAAQVIATKAYGTLLLHEMTKSCDLDIFAVYSSAACVFGTVGQSVYAAANAFAGSVVELRRSLGLRAICLDWGPWSEVGMVADSESQERFDRFGFRSLSPRVAHRALYTALELDRARTVPVKFDFIKWQELLPSSSKNPFFEKIQDNSESTTISGAYRKELENLGPESRKLSLIEFLCHQTASVLRMPKESLQTDTPLKDAGLDSLMTLELRNIIEREIDLKLSSTLIWRYPTIQQLAGFLASEIGGTLDEDIKVEGPTVSQGEEITLDAEDEEGLLDLLSAIQDS